VVLSLCRFDVPATFPDDCRDLQLEVEPLRVRRPRDFVAGVDDSVGVSLVVVWILVVGCRQPTGFDVTAVEEMLLVDRTVSDRVRPAQWAAQAHLIAVVGQLALVPRFSDSAAGDCLDSPLCRVEPPAACTEKLAHRRRRDGCSGRPRPAPAVAFVQRLGCRGHVDKVSIVHDAHARVRPRPAGNVKADEFHDG